MNKINYALKKIGLTFNQDHIIIQNEERWHEVSMIHRVEYKMTTTTNSLESTHGHLNHRTPRRNGFYSSILRICIELNTKFSNLNEVISHNYNRLKNITQNKLIFTTKRRMSDMIEHYGTTKTNCFCSENKVESSCYGIDIPCSHRLEKGGEFPEKPKIHLELEDQFNELKLDFSFIKNSNNKNNSIKDEMNYATRVIKLFSHYKNLKEINEFVTNHKKEGYDDYFILNKPVSLIQLIDEGIHHFSELKRLIKI